MNAIPVDAHAEVLYRIPGTPFVTGSFVTVREVRNNGTKKMPVLRYRVSNGTSEGWCDADALAQVNG